MYERSPLYIVRHRTWFLTLTPHFPHSPSPSLLFFYFLLSSSAFFSNLVLSKSLCFLFSCYCMFWFPRRERDGSRLKNIGRSEVRKIGNTNLHGSLLLFLLLLLLLFLFLVFLHMFLFGLMIDIKKRRYSKVITGVVARAFSRRE